LVGSRTAVERRYAAAERERPARAAGDIGLPVILLEIDDLETEAKLVRAPRIAEIAGMGPNRVFAEGGIGGVVVAESGVAGDGESRLTALPGIRTIGAGNAECVKAE